MCVVQERKACGLLDCIEQFVAQSAEAACCRPLVVMGSVQLTSHVFSYMASSVALSAVKRLAGTPVLILTLNSKNVSELQHGGGPRLRLWIHLLTLSIHALYQSTAHQLIVYARSRLLSVLHCALARPS